jgi:chromosome segregation ATPase
MFRSDSNLLATASEDGTLRFWEMNGGSEVKKIDAHPGGVVAFAFGRDGSFLTAGRDRKLQLWKTDFNLEKELAKNLPALPTAVALASEGARAFVTDAAGVVRAYDLKTGQSVGEFSAAPATIESRLAALRSQIQAQPAVISAAEGKLSESTAKLALAKKALADAEQAAKEAKIAHETAKKSESDLRLQLDQIKQQLNARRGQIDKLAGEIGVVSADLEARKQALAALPEDQRRPADLLAVENRRTELDAQISRLRMELGGLEKQEKQLPTLIEAAAQASIANAARLKPTEDQIGAKRQEIPATEKTLAEAKATLDSIKARTGGLQAAEKRWLAAAINTRALEARETSRKLLEESENHLDGFRSAAKALETPMKALRDARTERDEVASLLKSKRDGGSEEAHLKEIETNLDGLNAKVNMLAAELSKAETELATAREKIERVSPLLDESSREATKLKADYFSALK